MNAKLLSILFILFLGIGFSSCSKDKNESSFESGKQQGEKLRNAVSMYNSGNAILASTDAISVYAQYKANSSDQEWKKGFLGGATNFDESKYKGLENLLEQGITWENVLTVLPQLVNLLS